MNKKLLGLGMALAANGALAQTAGSSAIEIYGLIDIGVGYSEHSLSQDANYQQGMNAVATKYGTLSDSGMFNGGLSPSRIGFRGKEDLGGGLKAVFTLETGFNPQDGVLTNGPASLASNAAKTPTTVYNDSSLAGQLFNRQANVGLSSDWGTVTFGRNYSVGNEVLLAYDPMEGSGTFSLFGYSGSYAAGGFTEDLRLDSSIKYLIKTDLGVNFGALYKFGGQAGSTGAMSAVQLTLGYVNGPFGIQGAYSNVHDAISLASASTIGAPLAPTFADTTAYMLAGSYTFDQFRLRGGYEKIDFDNPANPSLDLGITNVLGYAVAPTATSVTTYTNRKTFDIYFAGVTYAVTPAFSTTLAYYDIKQNDYSAGACTTGSNVSTCSGTNQFYSVMGDYKLSKRSDLYAGYMHNGVQGGFSSGFKETTNGFFGFGMRHMF